MRKTEGWTESFEIEWRKGEEGGKRRRKWNGDYKWKRRWLNIKGLKMKTKVEKNVMKEEKIEKVWWSGSMQCMVHKKPISTLSIENERLF